MKYKNVASGSYSLINNYGHFMLHRQVMGDEVTVHEVKQTDSTNRLAKQLVAEGAKNLTLVWAHQQSSGRGRYGRDWISPAGNVFWSMILRPQSNWPKLSGLSHVAALAVHATISELVIEKSNVQIKWPNDVLVNGKKIAGILLEANGFTVNAAKLQSDGLSNHWAVVGIGINVAHYPTDLSYPATSLHAEGAVGSVREDVIANLTCHFVAEFEAYIEKGSAHLSEQLLPRMAGLGREIKVSFSDHPDDDIVGIFRGLDAEGRLIIATQNGELRTISTGEVFLGLNND